METREEVEQALATARKRVPRLPLVDEAKARAAGCNGYVAKPFSPRQLLAKVREFLPDEKS